MVARGSDEQRVPTVWVDTNVMLEVYSHGDAFDAGDLGDRGQLEERRLRMRGSLWMAMALCRGRVVSVTYQHENVRNILRMAPPGSTRGTWTAAILYIIVDGGVFDGWERMMTNQGAQLSNPQRDRFMIEQCRDHGMILVSRDREARDIAATEGVIAMLPEEYGASVLNDVQACEMFMGRLRGAVDRYPNGYPPEERAVRADAALAIFELYERLWMPAGSFET
jgi:hypothetical protein